MKDSCAFLEGLSAGGGGVGGGVHICGWTEGLVNLGLVGQTLSGGFHIQCTWSNKPSVEGYILYSVRVV